MLSDAPAYTILTAEDLERAKKFYSEVLGLESVDLEVQGIISFGKGQWVRLVLYEKKGATRPDNSVLGFDVENLEEVIKELEGKGVKFEDYPEMDGFDTSTHIANHEKVKSAWLKDSEGNIIALNQMA